MPGSSARRFTVEDVERAFSSAFKGQQLELVIDLLIDEMTKLRQYTDGGSWRWTLNYPSSDDDGTIARLNMSVGSDPTVAFIAPLWPDVPNSSRMSFFSLRVLDVGKRRLYESAKEGPGTRRVAFLIELGNGESAKLDKELRKAAGEGRLRDLQEAFQGVNSAREANDRVVVEWDRYGWDWLSLPTIVLIPADLLPKIHDPTGALGRIGELHDKVLSHHDLGKTGLALEHRTRDGYKEPLLAYLAKMRPMRAIPRPDGGVEGPQIEATAAPSAHVDEQTSDGSDSHRSRGRGRLMDAIERAAIEERAMVVARGLYEDDGWEQPDDVSDDVHRKQPYDLVFEKAGQRVYVEVKGKKTSPQADERGRVIDVTAGEVEHTKRYPAGVCHLVVVEDIEVEWIDHAAKDARGKGGRVCVHITDWQPGKSGLLQPTAYTWQVPDTDYRPRSQIRRNRAIASS